MGNLNKFINLNLILIKVFCFADKVGILKLQNAALNAIRNRAIRLYMLSLTLNIINGTL